MWGKPKRSTHDFADEIASHIQLEADRLVEDGMSRREAVAAARRTFGNIARTQERFYESTRWLWLDHLRRDIVLGFRQMKRAPVMTATIVGSLALGIGFNTAMFSIADQALIRSLPVAAPDRLVQLDWNGRWLGGEMGFGHLFPHTFYRQLREHDSTFVDVFARAPAWPLVTIGEAPESAIAEAVSGSYFPTLGVQPALGRVFTEQDDLVPNGHPVIVLAYDFWQSRFGADPAVIGRQIRLFDHPMTVIGVAEPGFRGTDWGHVPAFFVPMMMFNQVMSDENWVGNGRVRFLQVFARLTDALGREAAQARIQPWFATYLQQSVAYWPAIGEQDRREYLAAKLDVLPAARGATDLTSRVRQPLLILLAATGIVLLLACLNVATLLLARTLAKHQTTALQTALGASRSRILLQHLVETGLMAGAGSLAGLLLAPVVIRAVLTYMPGGASGTALNAHLDLRVLAVALGIAVLTAVICGTAPAFLTASVPPAGVIKSRSHGSMGGYRTRRGFVTGQFALALVLLIGAGLFVRTLRTLRTEGPGYTTSDLFTFNVNPGRSGYELQPAKQLLEQVLSALRGSPGVEQAAVAAVEILGESGWNNAVTVQSTERIVAEQAVRVNAVSPGFFATLGVPIVRGRDFGPQDRYAGPGWNLRSAVVNQEFVNRYIPSDDPIGARFTFSTLATAVPNIEIVGVVPTFQDRGLREPEAHVYVSLWERSASGAAYYVRGRGTGDAIARSIRASVQRVDPRLEMSGFHPMTEQLDLLLASERMLSAASVAFASIATLLATIGLYGVLSFSATLRSKEIGIRLALGARRWSAGGLIVREAGVLAGIGLAIALPLTWALGRFVENQLFGVRPLDPPTILFAASGLALVCIVACAGPARRASSIDPVQTLRRD